MNSHALKLYEKIIREYDRDNMQEVYAKTIDEFAKTNSINRYIYAADAELEILL